METMESTAFEQMILKLGLVNEAQLAEVHDEIGRAPDLQHLIAALERKGYLTPWQRGKVLKGDPDGYILGGYKLLYKIQSGSFGRVYRAVDPRDGRVVAVKVLRRRWSENEQRIEMFIREGKVGLMLKHPNIVEVVAINRDMTSGQYYIVMEFVEGGNLREILHIRKTMNVPESLRLIEDCANGLYYAYSRGMTHRDIKLTNILISDTGEAKLVDFGLAQFFSAFARTEDEKVDRTVDYAGLERGTDVKTGDVRSDIYFLGAVLYECLTGRPPLSMTKDKHARMRKGRFEEVRPIHPNEIDGPPSVLMLVETMMALDPKQRYQTPSQLLDAIRRVRREVEGKSGNGDDRPPTRTVFLAEPDDRLQDVLRDGLKDQGYRVFLAGDPMRALDRFHKQPFDGLIVDARTTGEEGVRVFENILDEAARRRLRCAAMLLLAEDQADRAALLPTGAHIAVMIETEDESITYRKMSRLLKELMEAAHDSEALPTLVRPAPLPPPSPPPRPTPRVVEEPPVPTPRVVELPPPVPAPRVVPTPTRPREEVVLPKPQPRREPIAPSAISPPPPVAVSPPPAFMGFSVMTDDSVSFGEESGFAAPRNEPTAPSARSATPPREEVEPPAPVHHEPVAAVVPPPVVEEEEEPAPPPPREAEETPTPVSYPEPSGDDFPMLALEEGIVLPPPEETAPAPRQEAAAAPRQEVPPPPRRQSTTSPPPRKESSTPPPPPRKAAGSSPKRQEVAPPPSRQESVPTPRRIEPRKKKSPEPVMQHVTHEDQLAPPDTHHWRDELGVPEKKVEKEKFLTRLQTTWDSMTPGQRSIAGLAALGLVIGLFFLWMISDMIVQSKFDKIQPGMSVEEVETILGGPGEKLHLGPRTAGPRKDDVVKPETFRWEKSNKIITVTFSNGKVLEGGSQIQEK